MIKKSHIIPDFMYKGLFDDKHFTALVDLKEMKLVSKKPDGIYDKNILCAKCDNEIIGKYESYASKILFGGALSEKHKPKYTIEKDPRGGSKYNVQNIDYTKFKLFLLSMLWRGHISKQSFFNEIDLGKYAENLRVNILNGDAGEENEFETMIYFYDKKFIPMKSLVPSRKFRMQSHICYLIHIHGISIIYKVSNIKKLEYFEIGKLKKDNSTNFYYLEGEIGKTLFSRLTGIKK